MAKDLPKIIDADKYANRNSQTLFEELVERLSQSATMYVATKILKI